MTKPKVIDKKKTDKNIIYLSIDHLKQGKYELSITLKNKVIKSLNFEKTSLKDAIN